MQVFTFDELLDFDAVKALKDEKQCVALSLAPLALQGQGPLVSSSRLA